MSAQEPGIGPQIGASLRDARRRLGLEVKEVEERTKIRARYIRALENEEWETLPGPAYIRGFLRTYGAMLGLDGETLADEYRRRHERSSPAGSSAAEPVLSERRGGSRVGPPSRGPLIAIVVIAIVAALYILGQLGGDDDEDPGSGKARTSAKQIERAERKAKKEMERSEPEGELTEVEGSLRALTSVQVCLVSGNDALIDDQLLSEGAEEQLSGEKVYRVDVDGGGVLFEVGDERRRVETTGRVSLEGDSRGIREIEPPGECP